MSWTRTINEYRKQNIKPDSKCGYCESTEELTIDHIVPMKILKLMGINHFESLRYDKNLMIVCKTCNQEKRDLIIRNHKPTQEAMKQLLS